MNRLLLRHAEVLVTMDEARREIRDGAVLCHDGVIEAVGETSAIEHLPGAAGARTIDLHGRVLLPGLVNTHHHMFQTLTRALPCAQDADLFGWLGALYPVWSRLTPAALGLACRVAMAELLLGGATTASDHHYLYVNGCSLEDVIGAADASGLRLHAGRGAMSVGRSAGGLPPDAVVEDEAQILRDTQRAIERWHDPAPHAMVRVDVAPCSPFSVSQALMRESAALARACGVRLHTHLAEDARDVAYTRERYGTTPWHYARELGWTGPDVWHAHCVALDAEGIAGFAASGTGIAHCPCSNLRLGSGIAPLARWLQAGVPVGLGVDGSSSNDGAALLAEARQAMLLARGSAGAAALGARAALELATRGGARVLGRDDIGWLAPGMSADLAAFRIDGVAHAGARSHDPVAALLLCAGSSADLTVVAGRVRVQDGQLLDLALPALLEAHAAAARALVRGD